MKAYYFGCWSPQRIGHYLYDADGHNAERTAEKLLPMRPVSFDGGLLNGVPDKQGSAVLFHGRGYTLLSFWDRSGDSRPGSSSTFILPGTLTFESAVEDAELTFPERWSRILFAVREYESGG